MDIINVISEQTTAVALAVVIMWFYNKLVLDFLTERKEMIEALRAERKEWLARSDSYMHELFELNRNNAEGSTALRAEIHSLKTRITELLLTVGKKEMKNE